jgi:hypothetical protein
MSKLAVFALVAAAVGPWLKVMSDAGGGHWLSADPRKSYVVLTLLASGAIVLYTAAIITSLVALAQVIARPGLRGGALAVGGLVLAVGGMLGDVFGSTLGGTLGKVLSAMGGGGGLYLWQTTVVIVAAAVVAEIVVGLASAPLPAGQGSQ